MKIRQLKDIAPINLAAGDSLQLTYREHVLVSGLNVRTKEYPLLTETFTEARTVDRVAIVELEGGELRALGMEQGIAGVFGKARA